MNVRIHTPQQHGSRVADVVRITSKRPTYLPSVQAVIEAQLRNRGVGLNVL
jgi:hypothetical protein